MRKLIIVLLVPFLVAAAPKETPHRTKDGHLTVAGLIEQLSKIEDKSKPVVINASHFGDPPPLKDTEEIGGYVWIGEEPAVTSGAILAVDCLSLDEVSSDIVTIDAATIALDVAIGKAVTRILDPPTEAKGGK